MAAVVRLIVLALVAGVLASLPVAASATDGTSPSARTVDVASRKVAFSIENENATPVACKPDGGTYRLRGELVGPRPDLYGASVERVNVLVHDLTSGSWFWHLRRHPSYDYATRLAARGETSLVIDRLGYDASSLADGNATCLGAQADMLHQVIQHLRSGHYDFPTSSALPPAVEHVVVHGHSVGAAIAQVEAGQFDDVDGLVLMSWSDSGASSRAVDEASQQSELCLKGDDYASFGQGAREYRRLLFATAPRAIQRTAATLRNPSPCGDPLSLSQMLSASTSTTTRKIEVPVLLLFGGKDKLNRDDAARRQAAAYSSSVVVTRRTIAGAGNALPLERSAATTRGHVLRWLATL
ncbi:MAG TPA: alpha/beta fold hydrolase [Nocardioides sp.]|nr:alpha/beta fold hydrolase [Nocardioides sp.]